MSEGTPVACPSCGKQFRWKPAYSRRKVKCTGCACQFRMPKESGGQAIMVDAPAATGSVKAPTERKPNSAASYELSVPDEPSDNTPNDATARCPSCGGPVKPDAVICINCGLNIKSGKKLKTKVK